MLPPIPPWEGLHPLIVHFPIALLMATPLLVLLGILLPRHREALAGAALVVMALGTAGSILAVETGEAAEELVEKLAEQNHAIEETLEEHEELAETTRTVFVLLTLVFAGILAVPRLLKRRLDGVAATVTYLLFLVGYAAGLTLLANTAHHGGLLVHHHGIRAPVAKGARPMVDIPGPAELLSPSRESRDRERGEREGHTDDD